jgi:hypothetical protein
MGRAQYKHNWYDSGHNCGVYQRMLQDLLKVMENGQKPIENIDNGDTAHIYIHIYIINIYIL